MGRWILLLAFVGLAGCGGKSGDAQAAAQANPGLAQSASDQQTPAAADSPFGAREPRTCQPGKFDGPPTARQAMDLFICASEKYAGGYEYLVSNVTVQTGKSRPYSAWSDSGATDMDVTQAVYPIQGRLTAYQCSRRDAMLGQDPARNCIRTDSDPATGTCYKSTFGEWHCFMMGAGVFTQGYQPPPTGG